MNNKHYNSYSNDDRLYRDERSCDSSDAERVLLAASGAALIAAGLLKCRPAGIATAIAGGLLLAKGITSVATCDSSTMWGVCDTKSSAKGYKQPKATKADIERKGIKVQTKVQVTQPRMRVYDYWRRLENLPNFMKHLKSVKELDAVRSHWKADVPGGLGSIDWEAEIVRDEPGRVIAWRSIPNSQIDNAGEVHFNDLPGMRGTELEVTISYIPPAGKLGKAAAKALNSKFEAMIHADIERFKEVISLTDPSGSAR